jgi:hypothetical protein
VTPAVAHIGGTASISILGSGFLASFATGGSVSFGPDITVNSVTRNSLTKLTANVTVGAGAAPGTRSVAVTNPDGGAAACTDCLVLVADPVISALTPSSGAQGVAHQIVVVSGSGFEAGATAKFAPAGVNVSSVTVNGPTSLSIDVTIGAAAAIGPRNLTISNANTGTTTCTGCFTIAAKPTITALTPGTLPRGSSAQTVLVSGSGFQPGAAVSFSGTGVTASVVDATPTTLTLSVTVAANAATTSRSVTVTNPDGGTVTKGTAFKPT